MKKRLFITLISVFVFIPFIKVNALELTQTMLDDVKAGGDGNTIGTITYLDDSGDDLYFLTAEGYTLASDISAGTFSFDAGVSTLDFNGFRVTGDVMTSDSELTIDGTGEITGDLIVIDNSIVTVNNGTYNAIMVSDAKLVINNATVNDLITVDDKAEIEINDGNFKDIHAYTLTDSEKVKSFIIKGGTFDGEEFGLMIRPEDCEAILISGGTFKGGVSAVGISSRTKEIEDTILNDFLADGYKYSTSVTLVKDYDDAEALWIASSAEKEISVVEETNDNSNQTTTPGTTAPDKNVNSTNNPKTGDGVVYYITMLLLSLIGFGGTGLYLTKKLN